MPTKLRHFWKKYIARDQIYISRQKFKHDDRELGLRMRYPLGEFSTVFDLGGYKGEWADEIWELYRPFIYIFEPVTEFYKGLVEKFKGNEKIKIFHFGLSDKNGEAKISLAENASRVSEEGDTQIQLCDIAEVIEELKVDKIDLVKLNIEGGEYQVLPRLISTGLINICTDVQVQFHDFFPKAKEDRGKIRASLKQTHHLTYDYPFTFENWRKGAKF